MDQDQIVPSLLKVMGSPMFREAIQGMQVPHGSHSGQTPVRARLKQRAESGGSVANSSLNNYSNSSANYKSLVRPEVAIVASLVVGDVVSSLASAIFATSAGWIHSIITWLLLVMVQVFPATRISRNDTLTFDALVFAISSIMCTSPFASTWAVPVVILQSMSSFAKQGQGFDALTWSGILFSSMIPFSAVHRFIGLFHQVAIILAVSWQASQIIPTFVSNSDKHTPLDIVVGHIATFYGVLCIFGVQAIHSTIAALVILKAASTLSPGAKIPMWYPLVCFALVLTSHWVFAVAMLVIPVFQIAKSAIMGGLTLGRSLINRQ